MQSMRPLKSLDVVIVGGSLSGLMCGIVLRDLGHHIHILEEDDDERESHMAGICLGRDAQDFLKNHDRIATPFNLFSNSIQILNDYAKPRLLLNTNRSVTSWDAFYYRLRAIFDGYESDYYPAAASKWPGDGSTSCKSNCLVKGISKDENGKMVVTFEAKKQAVLMSIKADLVIGADGPNSFVRNKYLPHIREKYAGYIVWRGTVSEGVLSKETTQAFVKNVTVHMKERQHCLAYLIPGPNGSLTPGDRHINFAWYTNQTVSDLDLIMEDAVTGHKHYKTVPSGRVRRDVWEKQVEKAHKVHMPAAFMEVLSKINNPFIQAITEFRTPQACFEDGRVLLVGDSSASLRPHTAFSASQAAFHVLRLAEAIETDSLRKWETDVLWFGLLHSVQSRYFGDFYQSRFHVALVSAVCYWVLCLCDRIRAWWSGGKPLLRYS